MAREGDLPRSLASVDPQRQVPDRVQVVLAVVVVALVLTLDLRGVIGFSSFGVLLYYAVANASAYTQDTEHRHWPRPVQVLGLLGCLVLVATLPWMSVVAGVAVFVIGVVGRALVRRARESR
jgi:APA family basic amino acid/polyamine antiporter